ncbi:MAG: ribonuclease VapC [Methanobrevibacter sp.]|nr:ribonuclease VapC [Methanobrevibacter sp.]
MKLVENSEIHYILDASGLINGFIPFTKLNFTVPEISYEVKDLKSTLTMNEAINSYYLTIVEPREECLNKMKHIISKSGDELRLSIADTKLLSLALDFHSSGKTVVVITDDYTIQNTLKILNITFKSILTDGIVNIYNWRKFCRGCMKEYPNDYSYDECEICGTKITKKRIK